jgi:hypothetical protein
MSPALAAGRADPSNPKELPSCLQCEIAALPTLFAHARRLVAHGRIGHNTGYLQKQSSPCIHKVQHTVLFVAGLKGTMSEAELHVLKARLRGGILNEVRRGEYRCPLPTGLVYDDPGNVVLDPDAQIRGAIAYFFETFSRVQSASQVVKVFRAEGLALSLPDSALTIQLSFDH